MTKTNKRTIFLKKGETIMPYAIQFTSVITGQTGVGPVLRKRIEKKLKPVTFKLMTKKEAEDFCDDVNYNPDYSNAIHTVVEVKRENIQREISDEKILGRKFWRENLDIMIERKKNESETIQGNTKLV